MAHRQPDEIAKSRKGGAMAVEHPLLAARGINAIYVKSIDGPDFKGGVMTAKIACLQYTPPPKSSLKKTAKVTLDIPKGVMSATPVPLPALPKFPSLGAKKALF